MFQFRRQAPDLWEVDVREARRGQAGLPMDQ